MSACFSKLDLCETSGIRTPLELEAEDMFDSDRWQAAAADIDDTALEDERLCSARRKSKPYELLPAMIHDHHYFHHSSKVTVYVGVGIVECGVMGMVEVSYFVSTIRQI